MNSPGSGKVETGREKVETTRDRRQNWSFPISTLIFKGLSSNIVLGQTAIIILCDTGSPINGKQKCSFFNQTESHIDNIWMFKERNGVGKKNLENNKCQGFILKTFAERKQRSNLWWCWEHFLRRGCIYSLRWSSRFSRPQVEESFQWMAYVGLMVISSSSKLSLHFHSSQWIQAAHYPL